MSRFFSNDSSRKIKVIVVVNMFSNDANIHDPDYLCIDCYSVIDIVSFSSP